MNLCHIATLLLVLLVELCASQYQYQYPYLDGPRKAVDNSTYIRIHSRGPKLICRIDNLTPTVNHTTFLIRYYMNNTEIGQYAMKANDVVPKWSRSNGFPNFIFQEQRSHYPRFIIKGFKNASDNSLAENIFPVHCVAELYTANSPEPEVRFVAPAITFHVKKDVIKDKNANPLVLWKETVPDVQMKFSIQRMNNTELPIYEAQCRVKFDRRKIRFTSYNICFNVNDEEIGCYKINPYRRNSIIWSNNLKDLSHPEMLVIDNPDHHHVYQTVDVVSILLKDLPGNKYIGCFVELNSGTRKFRYRSEMDNVQGLLGTANQVTRHLGRSFVTTDDGQAFKCSVQFVNKYAHRSAKVTIINSENDKVVAKNPYIEQQDDESFDYIFPVKHGLPSGDYKCRLKIKGKHWDF